MHKSRNCAHNFFCKNFKRNTSRMRLNFTSNSSVFGRTNLEITPRTFSVKLAGKKLPKCVWTSLQTASFLDEKSRKYTQHFFHEPCIAKTSKMHLNFTANCFVFACTNREIVPTTFSVKISSGTLLECVWTSPQTAPFLDAKILKLRPERFL